MRPETTSFRQHEGLPNDVSEDNVRSTRPISSVSRSALTTSTVMNRAGSPSTAQRNPTRSFYHRSLHGSLDPAQYSSYGVRAQTAELASLAISDSVSVSHSQPDTKLHLPSHSDDFASYHQFGIGWQADSDRRGDATENSRASLEVAGPTPPGRRPGASSSVPFASDASALTRMLQNSPTESSVDERSDDGFESTQYYPAAGSLPRDSNTTVTEVTSLLPKDRDQRSDKIGGDHGGDDMESQQSARRSIFGKLLAAGRVAAVESHACYLTLTHPKTWCPRIVWQRAVVHPTSLLPAVFIGLLLNILDALSYGMILFPLGESVFEHMGSDGMSMFYVSTIVAQLVFSGGGSIFKGGVGSEMIEVVPFMHKMAFTILHRVGQDNPKSVLATTILAYSISSILTGVVFFVMGACRLGSLIGFFPRHILIGCIGGVGWFLIATGLEVSARLDGELDYNLLLLHRLFRVDTVFLWLTPLVLAIILRVTQRFVKSNLLVGGYFVGVACLFYFFKFALGIPIASLREGDWVFKVPPVNNPWYHFYTLYDFHAVDWEALAATIPAMFALTFFGVLHVPINVPALSISTGEDNLNLDRELLAHGITNALSGCCGSIQNYLVYTNSLLFIDSGGNSRLAGLLLAAATTGVLFAGPVIIGYIPIMVVGALIFLLGIDLMQEALVETWGRVHRLEYVTILIIVVTMGAWDFVVGIFVGIVLACVNYVVQTSRKSAVRATYSGETANSTVRRPPVQLRFLKEAGQQTHIIKLAGFLFFGTIVGVENKIRALLAEDAFHERPIRYLILDLTHINGVDFSAAEAFMRISRLLKQRGVEMLVSGFDVEGEVGQSLRSVGLFGDENEVKLFEDLNRALEYCENELLQALYHRQAQLVPHRHQSSSRSRTRHLDVPQQNKRALFPAELIYSSPRRHHLHQVASSTLNEDVAPRSRAWHNFKQPLPLLLQIFEDLSEKGESFWFRATPFFQRKHFLSGTALFQVGDAATGFYLLEEGILRADSNSPQGRYSELIVAGRPCGELPFFSETNRTAAVTAERDCTVWELNEFKWAELQTAEPAVATEMLKICLKLTKERMDSVLGYLLTAAG